MLLNNLPRDLLVKGGVKQSRNYKNRTSPLQFLLPQDRKDIVLRVILT